jgi:hypothetical protein
VRALAIAIVAVGLVTGCSETALTEIVVVVDSDVTVPDELDAIRIDVEGLEGGPESATRTVDGASDLPGVLSLVHRGGALGPITITATGALDGVDRIERRAETSFVEGKSIVLRLDLLASCVEMACGADETCTSAGCGGIEVDPSTLSEWTGRPPRLDAGPPDEVDAGGNDAGRVDAGGTDAGDVDAGDVDAGDVDSGPRDAGPPDSGPPDSGPPDAGPPPCDDTYGMAPSYELCMELSDRCEFATATAGGTCNDICTRFGGTCLGALDNLSVPCMPTGTDDCSTPRNSEICICSR